MRAYPRKKRLNRQQSRELHRTPKNEWEEEAMGKRMLNVVAGLDAMQWIFLRLSKIER
jgi:hypothetical protein